ncbi:hypothetical protein ACEWY4_007734 [Coilia grayii]|uniref:MULE transposase domain-containing protein n=1 Tax=Coilia grayii TaxID=363190 RepID=A0ABD1K919_9TELE
MVEDLKTRSTHYNDEQGSVCAQMEKLDGQVVVAICTPLVQRIHRGVQQSGELVFVDSSGNCDRQNHRLFLILTHSAAGGLPLGAIITTAENSTTIAAGMRLWRSLLCPGSFFHQEDGPQTIMTDDCAALRQAMQEVFPKATLILCTSHLLQAMWRWLWNSHNNIRKQHRPQLMHAFRALVYAASESQLSTAYARLASSPVAVQYQSFVTHLAAVYRRRREWAICLRSHLPTRGHNTNNFTQYMQLLDRDQQL